MRALFIFAAVTFGALACVHANTHTPSSSNPADNPEYYKNDLNKTVITNIAAWSHPTKDVFKNHHLTLTKVELLWEKTFPVFHVTDFGADPGAGPANAFFTSLSLDLLKANGYHALKFVEDNAHDGFVVAYDRQTHHLYRELVQGESP